MNISKFYEKVIKYCLSGLYSQELARELPDLLIEIANNEWKLKENQVDFHSSRRNKKNEYFGLSDTRYFPSGIYKTPIYNLLQENTHKALEFIVEFIDYCTLRYIASDFSKKIILSRLKLHKMIVLK